MDAGLAIIAGAAGFIAYKVVSKDGANAVQPGSQPKQPFYSDWFTPGSQPATGNGTPTTYDHTGQDIANTTQAVTKFATSLLEYFGGAQDNVSTGAGVSTGGPTSSWA